MTNLPTRKGNYFVILRERSDRRISFKPTRKPAEILRFLAKAQNDKITAFTSNPNSNSSSPKGGSRHNKLCTLTREIGSRLKVNKNYFI
ncbi:hypothetical protein CQA63_09170 [Helicobacter marmotae]|uniref:Uncharacterized protein n=1 Tax=Helicobacter marmotae TaxID=152490 RepID=A0A3D8I138_9HELI|nr:hypothetical protein CQA63_09170 [Helicobacter marmotae]